MNHYSWEMNHVLQGNKSLFMGNESFVPGEMNHYFLGNDSLLPGNDSGFPGNDSFYSGK